MSEPPASHPSPGPRHAAPVAGTGSGAESGGHPRRWFLAGAGAAVLAAGGGVGAALVRRQSPPAPLAAPRQLTAALTAAIAAEQTLLADLDATTGGTGAVRQVLVRARADHAAHLQALVALATSYDTEPAQPAPLGVARSAAQLRAAEQLASNRSAARAAALGPTGAQLATVLASIAACEATHAALLS